jgi:hypothetical protein
MGEAHIIYLQTPARFELIRSFSEFVQNAKTLLDIPDGALGAMAKELADHSGFISGNALKQLLGRHLADEDKIGRLAKLFDWTANYFRLTGKSPGQLLDDVSRWQSGEENQKLKLLGADALPKLRQAIELVVKSYPSQILQWKADRLGEMTGLRAQAIDLICDLRPVFDESKDRIVGLIPLTTLRVVASEVDKIPVAFNVVLSARDVQTLLKKAEEAVKKLNTLGKLAEQNELPVPAIDLTETSD